MLTEWGPVGYFQLCFHFYQFPITLAAATASYTQYVIVSSVWVTEMNDGRIITTVIIYTLLEIWSLHFTQS